jgi:hypothetical protein
VTITAALSGVRATATLTVTPDGVATLNLSPLSVVGGAPAGATNTVTLLAPAPSPGATVTLTSSNPAVASLPASVKLAAGATTSAGFRITTTAVNANTPVTITASYNGIAVPATLSVVPLEPSSITLGQSSVVGGKTIQATVTLNAAAPAGGLIVSLSSSKPAAAAVPASVIVAAGTKTSPKFSITTSAVSSQIVVTITASYQGNGATATLTVNP